MIIKNGKVFQEDGSYKVADLYVENGRIVASADEVTDKNATGCIRTEGFCPDW
mgnify:CR=1 FL=1